MTSETKWQRRTRKRKLAVANGYRSGFEEAIAAQLQHAGAKFSYEKRRIQYTPPVKSYVVDFELPGGVMIEVKGVLTAADRTKYALVKREHPSLDLRFVFSNSKRHLNRTSRTTYAMWATRLGFPFADGCIPDEWLGLAGVIVNGEEEESGEIGSAS